MILIDGKKTSEILQSEIAEEVVNIKNNGGKIPHLAAVLVGNDGGSETYVAGKVKACEKVGFKSTLIRYDATVTQDELLKCISQLNCDEDLDGFIVQLPFPKHISEEKVIEAINPPKDVDGFQAEDGIRDRSPSRGLGDVYKRQPPLFLMLITSSAISDCNISEVFFLSLIHI